MTLRWTTIAILGLNFGCTTSEPICHVFESRSEWLRLSSPPDFVGASTYKQMYPRGIPPAPDDVVWYSNSSGRFAACRLGDRYGCGEFVSYFTGSELDDPGEIVVCGESTN